MRAPGEKAEPRTFVVDVLEPDDIDLLAASRPSLSSVLADWGDPIDTTWALVAAESESELDALEFLYVATQQAKSQRSLSFKSLNEELRRG